MERGDLSSNASAPAPRDLRGRPVHRPRRHGRKGPALEAAAELDRRRADSSPSSAMASATHRSGVVRASAKTERRRREGGRGGGRRAMAFARRSGRWPARHGLRPWSCPPASAGAGQLELPARTGPAAGWGAGIGGIRPHCPPQRDGEQGARGGRALRRRCADPSPSSAAELDRRRADPSPSSGGSRRPVRRQRELLPLLFPCSGGSEPELRQIRARAPVGVHHQARRCSIAADQRRRRRRRTGSEPWQRAGEGGGAEEGGGSCHRSASVAREEGAAAARHVSSRPRLVLVRAQEERPSGCFCFCLRVLEMRFLRHCCIHYRREANSICLSKMHIHY